MLYPLVKQEFYSKTLPQQTVENNQEILGHDKRLEVLEENYNWLKGQIEVIIEELKKNERN